MTTLARQLTTISRHTKIITAAQIQPDNIDEMLNHFFTSRSRIKVLSLLLMNPDEEYYGRQLEKLTGAKQKDIWRELNSLERVGLLKSRREANLKRYHVNKEFPIYEELRRIFIKTEGISDFLRSALDKSGQVEVAFIYGSVAAGTDRAGSDIDVFVVGRLDQARFNRLLAERELLLGRNINYSVMEREEFKRLKKAGEPFLKRILSGEKIMLAGSKSAL